MAPLVKPTKHAPSRPAEYLGVAIVSHVPPSVFRFHIRGDRKPKDRGGEKCIDRSRIGRICAKISKNSRYFSTVFLPFFGQFRRILVEIELLSRGGSALYLGIFSRRHPVCTCLYRSRLAIEKRCSLVRFAGNVRRSRLMVMAASTIRTI